MGYAVGAVARALLPPRLPAQAASAEARTRSCSGSSRCSREWGADDPARALRGHARTGVARRRSPWTDPDSGTDWTARHGRTCSTALRARPARTRRCGVVLLAGIRSGVLRGADLSGATAASGSPTRVRGAGGRVLNAMLDTAQADRGSGAGACGGGQATAWSAGMPRGHGRRRGAASPSARCALGVAPAAHLHLSCACGWYASAATRRNSTLRR